MEGKKGSQKFSIFIPSQYSTFTVIRFAISYILNVERNPKTWDKSHLVGINWMQGIRMYKLGRKSDWVIYQTCRTYDNVNYLIDFIKKWFE